VINRLNKIAAFFVYSNIYVVFVVASLLMQTSLLVDGAYFWHNEKVLFVLCASLFLYPLHRLLGALKLPNEFKQERHEYTEKHQKLVLLIIALSGLMSVYYALRFSINDWLMLMPMMIVSLGYVNPWRYFKQNLPALRDALYFKTIFVAAVVSFVTLVFPFYEVLEMSEITTFFASRFLFLIALTLPFDIRDMWLDKKTGVRTLATEFGKDKLIKISLFVNVLFSLSVFIQYYFFSHISLLVFVTFVISEILSSIFIRKLSGVKSDLWYAFAIEGMFVYQTLMLAFVVYFLG
jgi:4-hydroxybenzoate polyprenyltransferase